MEFEALIGPSAALRRAGESEDGYSAEMSTKQQTIGYSLVDRDRMLDDITLYWLTGRGAWEQPELFVEEMRAFFRLVR